MQSRGEAEVDETKNNQEMGSMLSLVVEDLEAIFCRGKPNKRDETGWFVCRKGWLANNWKRIQFGWGMSTISTQFPHDLSRCGFHHCCIVTEWVINVCRFPISDRFQINLFPQLTGKHRGTLHSGFLSLVFRAQSSAANSPQAGGNTQGVHCSVVFLYGEAQFGQHNWKILP